MSAFELGPDLDGLRRKRPYFLLPLTTIHRKSAPYMGLDALREAQENAARRIQDAAPPTDIYVLSHGWHRNLYAAVMAYDRLASRIANLRLRGRLDTPHDYRPLFICLHWHSEIGVNGWVDLQGRHHKADFTSRAREAFLLTDEVAFLNDFDDMFEYMQSISAPDTDASDPYLEARGDALCKKLCQSYPLRAEPPGAPVTPEIAAARVATLWTCYCESLPKQLLGRQKEQARSFLNPIGAIGKLLTALVGAVGVITLLAFLGSHGFFGITDRVADWWRLAVNLTGLPGTWGHMAVAAILWGIALLAQRAGRLRCPLLWALAGLPLFVLMAALLLTLYITGSLGITRWALYDERRAGGGLLTLLARWAAAPTQWARWSLRRENRAMTLYDTVASQFGFFRMQRKAVESAQAAAEALAPILRRFDKADVHLIGHSFGGLLVANLSRLLGRDLKTVCALQGALGAGFFASDPPPAHTTAAVFSRYDTANGFIYPLANQARCSMGAVGMSAVGKLSPVQPAGDGPEHPCDQTCVANHIHRSRGYAALADPPRMPGADRPAAINVDASRIIYEGSKLMGGGHDDLFKDDVVQLLWSLAHRDSVFDRSPMQPTPAMQPGSG